MSKIISTHRNLSAEDERPQRQLAGGGGGCQDVLLGVLINKESGSVYSLGILAALRRMDTQEEPAA